MRLNAARQLANRVPISSILRVRIGSMEDHDEPDYFWVPDEEDGFWADQIDATTLSGPSPRQLAAHARTFRDLECLVKALDAMETIASLTELSREYVASPHREIVLAANLGSGIRPRHGISGAGSALRSRPLGNA